MLQLEWCNHEKYTHSITLQDFEQTTKIHLCYGLTHACLTRNPMVTARLDDKNWLVFTYKDDQRINVFLYHSLLEVIDIGGEVK